MRTSTQRCHRFGLAYPLLPPAWIKDAGLSDKSRLTRLHPWRWEGYYGEGKSSPLFIDCWKAGFDFVLICNCRVSSPWSENWKEKNQHVARQASVNFRRALLCCFAWYANRWLWREQMRHLQLISDGDILSFVLFVLKIKSSDFFERCLFQL